MLYIIKEKTTNNYKIGVTNSIFERIKKLQCGNPEVLIIKYLYKTKDDYYYEKIIHNKFIKYNINNEWFKFNKDELCTLLKFIDTLNIDKYYIYS